MIKKLLLWLPKNLASVLGIIQAVLKFVKEILTLIVNVLYPIIPSKKFQGVVDTVRKIVNVADGWIEKLKKLLLAAGV